MFDLRGGRAGPDSPRSVEDGKSGDFLRMTKGETKISYHGCGQSAPSDSRRTELPVADLLFHLSRCSASDACSIPV
jgi:hypothetical protein